MATILCLPTILYVPSVQAQNIYTARVISVSDGDTIIVEKQNGHTERIRLYGIDAPENKQPYGKWAKNALKKMIYGKKVTINVIDVDRYGRQVAIVEYGIRKKKNANTGMALRGYAWQYDMYCRQNDICQMINLAQIWAQDNKRGVWRSKNPKPPWEYRKEQKTK